jgi:hypothetical protein
LHSDFENIAIAALVVYAITFTKIRIISWLGTHMIRLKIEELKPGMILARSVYNQQGLRLLEKDSALTKKQIWMIKTWGIDQVSIKGEPQEDDRADFTVEFESKETIEKELEAKFVDVIDDPIMQEIMKAAGRQLQKRLSEPKKENEPT